VVVVVLGLGLAVALVLFGAALAGAPAPPPNILQPGTAASPRPVNVIMRDYRFDPTPLYLVRGETVRINILNGGLIEHELVLGDESVQAAWRDADARATPPAPFATAPPASVAPDVGGLRALLGSGGSDTFDFVVPTTGDLDLICQLPGHAERGMVGEVTFAAP
jgi:uncharacterized cupredoxin-like copper-binding protein